MKLVSTDDYPVTLLEHEDGVHGFDSEQRDGRSAEIIELTLEFMKMDFAVD